MPKFPAIVVSTLVLTLTGCVDHFAVQSRFTLSLSQSELEVLRYKLETVSIKSGGHCLANDEFTNSDAKLECAVVAGTIGTVLLLTSGSVTEVVFETDYGSGLFDLRIPKEHKQGFLFVNKVIEGYSVTERVVRIVNEDIDIPVDEEMKPMVSTPWLPVVD